MRTGQRSAQALRAFARVGATTPEVGGRPPPLCLGRGKRRSACCWYPSRVMADAAGFEAVVLDVLRRAFAYGCMGLLVEIFFTGLGAVIVQKNWAATGKTYLWMLPIYGFSGVLFDSVRDFGLPYWVNAPIMVLGIYVIEFGSGWILEKIIGRCPWDYGSGRYTLMGYIRLDYAPFWLILALIFDPVSALLHRVLKIFAV